jgi:hypothetical protein
MSNTEYEAAVSEFLRRKGVTFCPTAYVLPTQAKIAVSDRQELQRYEAAKEIARTARSTASR